MLLQDGSNLMLTALTTYFLSCCLVGLLLCTEPSSAASVSYPDDVKNVVEVFKSDEDAAARVTDLVSQEKVRQALEERGLEQKDLLDTLEQLNATYSASSSPLGQLKLLQSNSVDKSGISEEDIDGPKLLGKSVRLTEVVPVEPYSPPARALRVRSYLTESSVNPQGYQGKLEDLRQISLPEGTEEVATVVTPTRSLELNQLDDEIPVSPSSKNDDTKMSLGKLQADNILPESSFSEEIVNSNEANMEKRNIQLQSNSKEIIEDNEDTQTLFNKRLVRQSSPMITTDTPKRKPTVIDEGLKSEELIDEYTKATKKPTIKKDEEATEMVMVVNTVRKNKSSDAEEILKSKQLEEGTTTTEEVPKKGRRPEAGAETDVNLSSQASSEEVREENEDTEPIARKQQGRALRSRGKKNQAKNKKGNVKPNEQDISIDENVSEIETEKKVANLKENVDSEELKEQQSLTKESEDAPQKNLESSDGEEEKEETSNQETTKAEEEIPEWNEKTSTTEKSQETGSEYNIPTETQILSMNATTEKYTEPLLESSESQTREEINGEENQSKEETTTEKLPEIEPEQAYTEITSTENQEEVSESTPEILREHNVSYDQTEEMGRIQSKTETEEESPSAAMDDDGIKEVTTKGNEESTHNSTSGEGILKLLSSLATKTDLKEIFQNYQGDPRVLAETLVNVALSNTNLETLADANNSNTNTTTQESEVQQQKLNTLTEDTEEEERVLSKQDLFKENQNNETNSFESTTADDTSDVDQNDRTSTTEKIVEALASAAEESTIKSSLSNSKEEGSNKGNIVFITSSQEATEKQKEILETDEEVKAVNEEDDSLAKDVNQGTTDEPAISTQKMLPELNQKFVTIPIFEVINVRNNEINGSQLEEKKILNDEDMNVDENEISQNSKLLSTPEDEKSNNKTIKKKYNNSVSSNQDAEEEEEPAKGKEDNGYTLEDSTYLYQKANKSKSVIKNVLESPEDVEAYDSEESKLSEKINKKTSRTEDEINDPEKTNEGIS